MISYILRLINEFRSEHGCRPNLLYLNRFHLEHLKQGFSDDFSLQHLCEMFEMELVVDREVMHPHVAWIQTADKLAM